MNKTKILIGFITLLYILFVVFEFIDIQWLSDLSRALVVPAITVLFFANNTSKISSFAIFLLLFSLAELLYLLYLIPFFIKNMHYIYYLPYLNNGLYILSYCFLIYTIVKSLNIKILVKNFFIHILVLGGLNTYLLLVLFEIAKPKLMTSTQIFIDVSYNVCMLLVLSSSLINFLYKDTKKSLFMFLGCLSLIFAEVIRVAYLHLDKIFLDVSYTGLFVLGFCLFCRQAFLDEKEASALSGNEVYE